MLPSMHKTADRTGHSDKCVIGLSFFTKYVVYNKIQSRYIFTVKEVLFNAFDFVLMYFNIYGTCLPIEKVILLI